MNASNGKRALWACFHENWVYKSGTVLVASAFAGVPPDVGVQPTHPYLSFTGASVPAAVVGVP